MKADDHTAGEGGCATHVAHVPAAAARDVIQVLDAWNVPVERAEKTSDMQGVAHDLTLTNPVLGLVVALQQAGAQVWPVRPPATPEGA